MSAHSSIGLIVGALMYVICLTGTLLVFSESWERWQQPEVPEFYSVDGVSADKALDEYLSRVTDIPESIYVVLPTEQLPRIHVADRDHSWWTDADGNIDSPTEDGIAHFLEQLHVHLHMPSSLGLIVVSIVGAMLVSLIISGLVGHPGIIKQAFQLRLGGRSRIEQTDIHNRLSVWGLPFHIMIALTGAFYGLVGFLVLLAASALYDGDRNALFDDVYGKDPVIKELVQKPNINQVLINLAELEPEAEPIYAVVQNFGNETQFIELAAVLPGRFTYSEIYRFYSDGRYMNTQGLASGHSGRQFLYSLYRVHFGWFGGWGVRWLYFALGCMLTVISVTGINIWLCKRAKADYLDRTWSAIVWGVPLALVGSAVAFLMFSTALSLAFFSTLLAAIAIANGVKISLLRLRSYLILVLALSLIALVFVHCFVFSFLGSLAASWAVNASLLLAALGLLVYRFVRNAADRSG
ncbi:PepSY-associated TM helix domain-containing protein [Agaribacterium sp. ZY112]|uniref:PepSY-associated TM helix domain-containing protein n=1 Tax=Agaribacterium sp. ZY112 TaxID=3233574 RepID=UPI003524168B